LVEWSVLLICAIAAFIVFEISSMRRQAIAVYLQAEQHLADHQTELADAVAEVLSKHKLGSRLDAQSVPAALQIPDMVCAVVGEAHVSLIIYSSPDTNRGYRVWNGEQSADFEDTATSIPGVYKFTYCDDYPDSPKNRPDQPQRGASQ
jgi:hypothetical protein